jgi:hypothetical protein
MPSADFCRLLRINHSILSPEASGRQTSQGKFDSLPRTTAEFTTNTFDGYGLRDQLLTRPVSYASYPVFIHRLALLFHASFRHHLAMMPLRFTNSSSRRVGIE